MSRFSRSQFINVNEMASAMNSELDMLEAIINAKDAEISRLVKALTEIAETNQIREFMGNDKNDGYGDGGWVVRDGQYAKLARAALKVQP